uniref:VWFA domain-containing protein n=1 Tax=Ciona savignyi TaxID=51511 RepID=H2ZH85_CIOSA
MLRFCFAMFLLVDLRFPVSAIDPFMSENENANGFSEVFVRSGVTTDDEESFGSGNDTVDFIDSRSFYKVDIMNQALQPGDCITRQKQLDMVFVLDTTLESTLSHMKEFVMDTLKIFELGQDKIRVAVTAAQGNAIVTLNQGIGHRQVQSLLGNLGTSATFNVVSALDAGRRITTDGSREVRKLSLL